MRRLDFIIAMVVIGVALCVTGTLDHADTMQLAQHYCQQTELVRGNPTDDHRYAAECQR